MADSFRFIRMGVSSLVACGRSAWRGWCLLPIRLRSRGIRLRGVVLQRVGRELQHLRLLAVRRGRGGLLRIGRIWGRCRVRGVGVRGSGVGRVGWRREPPLTRPDSEVEGSFRRCFLAR